VGHYHTWERSRILVGKPEGKTEFQDLDVDGRILLKLSQRNRLGRHGVESSGSE